MKGLIAELCSLFRQHTDPLPMSEAPKDGSEIVVFLSDDEVRRVFWDDGWAEATEGGDEVFSEEELADCCFLPRRELP